MRYLRVVTFLSFLLFVGLGTIISRASAESTAELFYRGDVWIVAKFAVGTEREFCAAQVMQGKSLLSFGAAKTGDFELLIFSPSWEFPVEKRDIFLSAKGLEDVVGGNVVMGLFGADVDGDLIFSSMVRDDAFGTMSMIFDLGEDVVAVSEDRSGNGPYLAEFKVTGAPEAMRQLANCLTML